MALLLVSFITIPACKYTVKVAIFFAARAFTGAVRSSPELYRRGPGSQSPVNSLFVETTIETSGTGPLTVDRESDR